MLGKKQIDDFFAKRSALLKLAGSTENPQKILEDKKVEWLTLARHQADNCNVASFIGMIELKTSQNGILEVGIEIAEKLNIENPLLYASTLKGFKKRKDYLTGLLKQIKNIS